ncbi:FtsB family cell division protein [Streptomyces lonarensis]|uniref:Septum formation initiator n=1 Tax=Streptomyces lonarensis TaxID=700599 RepID=A0A7X6D2V3_9ACTN|nr:hypothetical protein [Streptomyces lonarensis]NJQ07175.1 hypothetical protein [Streptomyces lonarensis]
MSPSGKGPATGAQARLARLTGLGPGSSSGNAAARTPFVLLIVVLLGAGMLSLLLLNAALNQGSFELSELRRQAQDARDEQQSLQAEVDGFSAPDALAERARELGLVPGGPPVFLAPDGSFLGDPVPAPPPEEQEEEPVVDPAPEAEPGPEQTADPDEPEETDDPDDSAAAPDDEDPEADADAEDPENTDDADNADGAAGPDAESPDDAADAAGTDADPVTDTAAPSADAEPGGRAAGAPAGAGPAPQGPPRPNEPLEVAP